MGTFTECKELLLVVEGLHGEKFYRIDLVFFCEHYDRLDMSTLNAQPLYPSKLKRQIMNYYEGKPYRVYLGNKEAGDPECLD